MSLNDDYDHAHWLRQELRRARDAQGKTALQVDAMVAAKLGETRNSKHPEQRIYHWEAGQDVKVSQLEAWAAVLGFRLEIQLVDAASPARPMLVRSDEAAQVAAMLDTASESDRAFAFEAVRRILTKST